MFSSKDREKKMKQNKKILITFDNANLSKIESMTGNKSDFINKCCAYILMQPDAWIAQFIARQDRSWTRT